jgi:hypothetical protein
MVTTLLGPAALAGGEPALNNRTMAGPRDVIEQLTEDHRRLEALIERLDTEEDPAAMRLDFLQIVGELGAHEACEQEVVFPALRACAPAEDADTVARLGEHDEINELLSEMRGLVPSSLGFGKRASALLLELKAHFAEEEEGAFACLRSALGADELASLTDRANRVRAYAPAFPGPHEGSRRPRPTVTASG